MPRIISGDIRAPVDRHSSTIRSRYAVDQGGKEKVNRHTICNHVKGSKLYGCIQRGRERQTKFCRMLIIFETLLFFKKKVEIAYTTTYNI